MILCFVIVCGLIYLIFSGATQTLNNNEKPTPTISPLPTVEPTSTPTISPTPSATPKITYDITSDTSLYKLVTRTLTIGPSYVPSDLVSVPLVQNGQQYVSSQILDDLVQMFTDASKAGVNLYLVSGYRSYEDQVSLYNYYCDEFGMEHANAIDAVPGASEHQLGLAVDLGDVDRGCELDTCYSETSSASWLEQNAHKYGFILRYPEGKEDITGVIYSPWHYRYVGQELATLLTTKNQTMEEFFENQ